MSRPQENEPGEQPKFSPFETILGHYRSMEQSVTDHLIHEVDLEDETHVEIAMGFGAQYPDPKQELTMSFTTPDNLFTLPNVEVIVSRRGIQTVSVRGMKFVIAGVPMYPLEIAEFRVENLHDDQQRTNVELYFTNWINSVMLAEKFKSPISEPQTD